MRMAASSTTELIEEDAADLQFPKDMISSSSSESNNYCHKIPVDPYLSITSNDHSFKHESKEITILRTTTTDESADFIYESLYFCAQCIIPLSEPYIICAECRELCLCLGCFSQGAEPRQHSSNHRYTICDDSFDLFDCHWTAREEKRLLELIEKCGYGNWGDISKILKTKTEEQCKNHYNSCYVENRSSHLLPKLQEPSHPAHYVPLYPYSFKEGTSEGPPRPAPDTVLYHTMAGYRAARSEFDTPYDASAESIITNVSACANEFSMESEDHNFEAEVHCAVVRAYINRLRERHRRYAVIREHGLLVGRRTAGWLAAIHTALCIPGPGLAPFMQVTNAQSFDYLMESLNLGIEMTQYLYRLIEMRENGITSFNGAKAYRQLKSAQNKYTKERPPNLVNWEDVVGEPNTYFIHTAGQKRRSVPLEIRGMPGYEHLSSTERSLCSLVRLMPMCYVSYRDLLVNEFNKTGSLRLADARKLIKIDVNKTRLIYDHLVKEGYVTKPSS